MIMPVRTLLRIAPILSVLAGCSSPDPQMPPNKAVASGPQRTADTVSRSERALPSGYVLTDTTDWGNPLEEGTRAILRRGVTSIDPSISDSVSRQSARIRSFSSRCAPTPSHS